MVIHKYLLDLVDTLAQEVLHKTELLQEAVVYSLVVVGFRITTMQFQAQVVRVFLLVVLPLHKMVAAQEVAEATLLLVLLVLTLLAAMVVQVEAAVEQHLLYLETLELAALAALVVF
jgi:hypothetical protein